MICLPDFRGLCQVPVRAGNDPLATRLTKAVLADQLSPIVAKRKSWGQSFNFTTPRAGTAGG